MSTYRDYLEDRKKRDPEFAEEFEKNYENFKLNAMIKALRIESGISQQEMADRIGTKKSTISRMENHAEDIRFSTLQKVASACGKKISISFV